MKKNISYTMFFKIMLPCPLSFNDEQTVFLTAMKFVLLHKKVLNPL
jgi:hypothetical protein